MAGLRILVVRLGAMGDVIHALPAAATLKHNFPQCRLSWAVEQRWTPLLEGNPYLDEVLSLDRTSFGGLLRAGRRLRAGRFELAVDFQGLLKSALVASVSRPERIVGFHHTELRERAAALFYSTRVKTGARHVVDRNLELAAGAGASSLLHVFPLPPGMPEGSLPQGEFVLANPIGGWPAKQWPLEFYDELARRIANELGLALVLNGPPQAAAELERVGSARVHLSGLAGLIHATRRAIAVVGIDSGPMHLAAALGKPGVAIFGPTDPARNGPYGNVIRVLRSPRAVTTYKRRASIDPSMGDIPPAEVFEALAEQLALHRRSASCSS